MNPVDNIGFGVIGNDLYATCIEKGETVSEGTLSHAFHNTLVEAPSSTPGITSQSETIIGRILTGKFDEYFNSKGATSPSASDIGALQEALREASLAGLADRNVDSARVSASVRSAANAWLDTAATTGDVGISRTTICPHLKTARTS